MRLTDASKSAPDGPRFARSDSHRLNVTGREFGAGEALAAGSPSEFSSHAGRLAALAVAVGVGAAIASMPAVAFADVAASDGSANSSSSPETGASAEESSTGPAAPDSSNSADESSPAGSSIESGDAASDDAADVAPEIDEPDIDDADPTEATLEASLSDPERADSVGDTAADDAVSVTGADPAEADLDDQAKASDALSEGTYGDGAASVRTPRAAHSAEPSATGRGAAAESTAGAFRLFGNGTAANPDAGILFGSGFSWDGNSCTGGVACHGGKAGLFGGNGGNGFNGGNGGAAGWFGSGGHGGAGLPGGNGGNGGNGGTFFGTGGNGGAGGAALVAGDTPGLGGDGGKGGLFGSDGSTGNDGAAFPSEPGPGGPPAPTPGLTFDFIYGTGSQYWSSSARQALQATASSLASYIVVESPVTLTIDVSGANAPFDSTLAWASSDLSGSGSGFLGTVAQEKIQTGVDLNGAAADGKVHFNFGPSWNLGNSVGGGQYDFRSTAMHELMHTLGFISFVDRAGSNTSTNWTAFDGFIVNSSDVNVIGSDFRWNSAYNSNLTDGNGGLYFGGPNAVAVYGGLVPLHTPSTWTAGSSVTHLDGDTFRGANAQLMTAVVKRGPGIRTLSSLELAILEDLGYTVVSQQGAYGALLLTLVFVRRRKTSPEKDHPIAR